MDKHLKLRIFFYGKNALDILLNINKSLEIKLSSDDKYKVKPYISKDKQYKWDYFIFHSKINDDTNDTIKCYLNAHYQSENLLKYKDHIQKIISLNSDYENNIQQNKQISFALLQYHQFYDILVICINNLLDEESIKAFKYFQGFSQNVAQQPFILFITNKDDNSKMSDLYQFITNEFFDKRNLFILKFDKSDEYIEKINKFFINCMNYYHELGNNEINYQLNTFNILICGQEGVGKSTFINQFMQEKVANEGEGLSITHKIANYVHPKYPIRIYDTPGFENEDTVANVRRTIEKLEKDLTDSNKHIDLILYFNQLKERNFLQLEMELIQWLIKENKKIIFVLNDFQNSKKSEIIKLTDLVKESLKKIIGLIPDNDKIIINDIIDNVIPLKLKQSLFQYEDENEINKTIIKQCYGMDTLFSKIYEIFIKEKISIDEIESAKDTKQIISQIKKFKLLKNVYDYIKVHINKKLESTKFILYYSYQDYFVWLMKDKRRNELIQKINELYSGDSIDDVDSLRMNIKNMVDTIENKNKIIDEYLKPMKIYKGIFEKDGYYLDSSYYNENTFMIGYLFLKPFLNKFNQSDEILKKSLNEICTAFNKAIDAFKELSEEWENVYKSLKLHKSDSEWINKYFILEVPKDID